MNVREMRLLAKSLIRDGQMIDAHFLRWLNIAYRQIARIYDIPRLHSGNAVTLSLISGETQRYILPYDCIRTISFFDSNGRSLDIIKNEDVRQFGEYNTFGSFVQFYEPHGVYNSPLTESATTGFTLAISNRSTTATASGSCFLDSMVGEYLLPISRNTASTFDNPEDYAYKIASVTSGTVAVLSEPFRGVMGDNGIVGDLTTGYFEVRPRRTPVIRIWGNPGASASVTINAEYQKAPMKLANDEDSPEEDRLSETLVYKAIEMAGWAYINAFQVKQSQSAMMESLAQFVTVKDFDKKNIHNFIQSNPQARSYSQISGMRMGTGWAYNFGSTRY